MSNPKGIYVIYLLLVFASCKSEKTAFKKKILFNVKTGFPTYLILPAYVNSDTVELCLTDDNLRNLTRKDGKWLPEDVFQTKLKKAINDKYVFSFRDTSELIKKYYVVNDSVYNYISRLGFEEMKSRYLVVNYKAEMIRTDLTTDDMNAVVKVFYLKNYIVETGDYTGYSYPIAPPHKLPTRAMRRAAEEPFRKHK